MGMILRIASSRIVGQGDIVGRSGYFSLNLSANSVMRGRLDARRTLKSLVADLRFFYLSSTHSAEFERLIAENYIKAKTVTDLAQMIGYGVNSFRMKFKKVFGIPAYEWLMQEKSKRLLVAIANSEDDFKNIIDEFDFSSHSHFYKFCKARFGYSPTELRKKLKSL